METNVAGLAVHIGARILANARAGEVLVSGTVKDLVVGSGLSFQDRGVHHLKGVPGEWRLFRPYGTTGLDRNIGVVTRRPKVAEPPSSRGLALAAPEPHTKEAGHGRA
jgi:hypothetical protein